MDTIPIPELIEAIHIDQTLAIAFLVLVVLSVGVRMYVRVCMTKQFGLQDWAMLVTFVFAVTHLATTVANCSISLKLTNGDMSLFPAYKALFKTIGTTFVLTLVTLKISVGFFFLYIFPHERAQRVAIYAIMIVSVVSGLAYLPLGSFTCAQFKKFAGEVKTCPDRIQDAASILFGIFTVVNIIGDFSYCLMGCVALWRATLPLLTKISASLLICLASLGGVASVVRLALFLAPADVHKFSQEEMWLIRWILIEVGFSVIAANLAMAKPLFQAGLVKLGIVSDSVAGAARRLSAGSGPRLGRPGHRHDDSLGDDFSDSITLVSSKHRSRANTVELAELEG